ncbi:cell wall-associated NlpC family hydrolase [Virgibacillus natechei]|uniref:Cell wall-associated NlpC family hydrolase n=1 Tax=Virgibacillus natechei TaxID=1216297 RepID=A0ABS4IHS4_9BACI|nr:NlpC/P60 family protein [Virgibacillus natechei]MBP1970499.1 cell wall-associated NlpC family hydrolase [Virgibacillus natechei]UZD14096.1 NlpC/P60 family protein [Virgibacillus natechei]
MLKSNHSVRKYIVSTAIVTSLVFTPILSGSVFAYGGPDADAEADQNNTPVNEQVDKKETSNVTIDLVSIEDRGEAVRDVQTALNDQGYDLNEDGIFGPNTDGAVRDFQTDRDLLVDGIVGPETTNALSLNTASNDGDLTIEEAPDQEVDTTTTSSQSEIVSIAESLVGTPYTWGGTDPETGFDSSGFINYVFAEAGIDLDRTHADMWANNGTHVDDPSVGDVVFFENTYQDGVSHSGIYIGNNEMIHAGTAETGVEVTTMSYDYWQDSYIGAKSFD